MRSNVTVSCERLISATGNEPIQHRDDVQGVIVVSDHIDEVLDARTPIFKDSIKVGQRVENEILIIS